MTNRRLCPRPCAKLLTLAIGFAACGVATGARAQLDVGRRNAFDTPPPAAPQAPDSIYGPAAAAVLRNARANAAPAATSAGASPAGARPSGAPASAAQSLPTDGFAGGRLTGFARSGGLGGGLSGGEAAMGGTLAASALPRRGVARSTDPGPTCRLACARTVYACLAQEAGEAGNCSRERGVCLAACASQPWPNLGDFAAPQ